MVMYLTIIIVATILIAVLNIFCNPMAVDYSWWWIVIATVVSVVIEIGIDGLFAGLVHAIPEKFFDPEKKFFNVSKKERKFYEKIKIKSWKDKVWELGALDGFRKNKIADPNNPVYLRKFLVKANIGMIVHIAGCIMGFAVMLFLPFNFYVTIGLPVALVGFVLNIMPLMVLRYNTPKLKAAYERARRVMERKRQSGSADSDAIMEESINVVDGKDNAVINDTKNIKN